ncbi:MAG TPA: hypothetical protein VK217_04135, partial [Acidimicrobiales bacterium]|nr:hypothetical protein [Acidimicrobiales bacterium]
STAAVPVTARAARVTGDAAQAIVGRLHATGGTVQVPGAGGYSGQQPIRLPAGTVISPARPLRVMLIGDSVMYVAELGINAALGATGEVTVGDRSIDGFGLSVDSVWRTSLSMLISEVHPEIIIGTWGWDDTCTWDPQIQHSPCALEEPIAYKRELEQAVRLMLAPGNGVSGVIFAQYPLLGPVVGSSGLEQRAQDATRTAGGLAWQNIVRSLPSVFPGKVMYLPLGSSVLLDGSFSSWLPPAARPEAPPSEWVRVRMEDNVHLCPAGVVRYADAVLADLTELFRLGPASPRWWDQPWVTSPRYNDPPGSCPDDHPPA